MTSRYGIDTSVLLRLMIGQPRDIFDYTVRRLRAFIADGDAEVFVSNQVIGEAFVSARHHYGLSPDDARNLLLEVLEGALVSPLNGSSVLNALQAAGGPGLFDRLITDGYAREDMEVLTLDRRMSSLPGARSL